MTDASDPYENLQRSYERLQRHFEQATQSSEKLKQFSEQATRGFDVSQLQQLSKQMTSAYDKKLQNIITQQIRSKNTFGAFEMLSQNIGRKHSTEMVQNISKQIGNTFAVDQFRKLDEQLKRAALPPNFEHLNKLFTAATSNFENVVAEAGVELPGGEPETVGWWIATRPIEVQAALLFAGLQVLDVVLKFIEGRSGADIPDSVQDATQVCFALVAFLILWFEERGKDDQKHKNR